MQSLYEEKARQEESQQQEEEAEEAADKSALLRQIVQLLCPGETVLKVQGALPCGARVSCDVHVTVM